MNKFISILFLGFYLSTFGQFNEILVEHLTGNDAGYMNFLIVDSKNLDSTEMANVKLDKAYSLIPIYLVERKSFKKLNAEFCSIKSSAIGDSLTWGSIRITRFNPDGSIRYQRNLCCGESTLTIMKELSQNKKLNKFYYIKEFFQLMLFTLEETRY